jgi:hypothetical protein
MSSKGTWSPSWLSACRIRARSGSSAGDFNTGKRMNRRIILYSTLRIWKSSEPLCIDWLGAWTLPLRPEWDACSRSGGQIRECF